MADNLGDLFLSLGTKALQNEELIRQNEELIRQNQHQEEMAPGQEELHEEALREEVHQNNVGGAAAEQAVLHVLGDQDNNDRNRIVNLEEVDGEVQSLVRRKKVVFPKKWIIIGFVVFSMLAVQFSTPIRSTMQKMHRMAMKASVASVEVMSRYLSDMSGSEDEDVPASLSDL